MDETRGATPDSLRVALRDLVADADGRRTVAVVGALDGAGGDLDSIAQLDGVGRLAVRLNVARLVAVGDAVRAVHTGALQEGSWGEESRLVPDVTAAAAWLADEVRPGDVVLVAGSAQAGLGVLVSALHAQAAHAQEAGR